MGFDVIAGYLLASAGIAMAGVVAFAIRSRDINIKLALDVLSRCLRERTLDRARKLCLAAPGSFFDAIHAAIVAGLETASRDKVVIESLVVPAFERRAAELERSRKARLEVGAIGVLLAVAGFAVVGSRDQFPIALAVIAGLAVLIGAWLFVRRGRLAFALERSRAAILPALVDALIDGERTKQVMLDAPAPPRPTPAPAPPASVPAPAPSGLAPAPAPQPRTPGRALPGTSLRDGACPLCAATTITRVELAGDARFHKLVCMACGYTQEFADLAQIP